MRTSELEMSEFEERANIKFCQKSGKNAAETFEMMQQVCSENSLSSNVVIGNRWFLQGKDSLENDEWAGRPQTVRTERKIQEVATLMRASRSQ